jgi:casein kinase II subunit alpha
MATFAPKPGQMLSGLKGTYAVSKQINGTIWNAARSVPYRVLSAVLLAVLTWARNSDLLATVLKTAPVFRLRREQNILERFQNHPTIRQLIDYIEDPPCLVLEHLESDGLQCSGEAKLSRPDIKLIAKSVLGALKSLHEMDIAHTGKLDRISPPRYQPDSNAGSTDVKPDNVLLNFHKDGTGVAEAKLADCGKLAVLIPWGQQMVTNAIDISGDAWDVSYDTNPKGKGHIIGATIFRSPEAILSHRWSTPTDIWSFGATVSSLTPISRNVS